MSFLDTPRRHGSINWSFVIAWTAIIIADGWFWYKMFRLTFG
jgi:hypothetical protein